MSSSIVTCARRSSWRQNGPQEATLTRTTGGATEMPSHGRPHAQPRNGTIPHAFGFSAERSRRVSVAARRHPGLVLCGRHRADLRRADPIDWDRPVPKPASDRARRVARSCLVGRAPDPDRRPVRVPFPAQEAIEWPPARLIDSRTRRMPHANSGVLRHKTLVGQGHQGGLRTRRDRVAYLLSTKNIVPFPRCTRSRTLSLDCLHRLLN
jgi:hypothetical protein